MPCRNVDYEWFIYYYPNQENVNTNVNNCSYNLEISSWVRWNWNILNAQFPSSESMTENERMYSESKIIVPRRLQMFILSFSSFQGEDFGNYPL